MDPSSLQRLADAGLGAFPPADLDKLAEWCREFCWASGQVAYCILADLFYVLHEAWDGPVLASTSHSMSQALSRDLPAILENEAEVARVVALNLHDEVLQVLGSQQLPPPNRS